MRGWDAKSDALFSYVSCEGRVPKDHPLRSIRRIVDEALAALSPEFEQLYAKFGRPSIPPERLLRALLLPAFYSVRSELQLMEQLDYNPLFRWFVGLSLDAAVWDATVFTKNRERLMEGDIARKVHGCGLEPRAGQSVAVGRPLLGGRDADRGVGQHEELSPQGRQRRAASCRTQWRP
jgi:transposase